MKTDIKTTNVDHQFDGSYTGTLSGYEFTVSHVSQDGELVEVEHDADPIVLELGTFGIRGTQAAELTVNGQVGELELL